MAIFLHLITSLAVCKLESGSTAAPTLPRGISGVAGVERSLQQLFKSNEDKCTYSLKYADSLQGEVLLGGARASPGL